MVRVKTFFWTIVLLIFAYVLLYPDNYFLKSLDRSITRKIKRIKKYITSNKDVLFLLKFDKPDVVEWISGKRALSPGTITVPAKNGFGRKFDGKEKTYIEFPFEWHELGNNYTVAMWIKISDKFKNQYIFYNSGLHRYSGFCLEKGALTFDVPSKKGRQCVSYSFTRYNEFVHIAASVDLDEKVVKLYENGKIKALNDIHLVDGTVLNMMIGKPFWYETRYPFKGIIDSIILWEKVISPREIMKLAKSKNNSLLTLIGFNKYYNLRLAQFVSELLNSTTKLFYVLKSLTIDSFYDSFKNKYIPEIHIIMSSQDSRHFINSHKRSRLSGRRTNSASRFRSVKIISDKKVISARIKLAGTNTDYNDSKRPAYIIETHEKNAVFGFKQILLAPPESSDFLMPVVNTNIRNFLNLSFISNGFCKLNINGMFRGIYYFEDFNRMGILPGELSGICNGIALHKGAWSTVFDRENWPVRIEKSGWRWPFSEEILHSFYDEAYQTWGGG